EQILGELNLDIHDKVPTEFSCNCEKARVEKALISIGQKELLDMIEEGKTVEVNCHFCNTNYEFTVAELQELLKKATH
ncbi:MAG: Hsp33 family molecular chaperone HslO, partial [Hungatella sp.]